jgi:hypothetical protein
MSKWVLVLSAAFAGEWPRVMDSWGHKMLGTVAVVAEVVARGFGLQSDAFTRRMQHGPHLLAPTGMSQLVCMVSLSHKEACSSCLGQMGGVGQDLVLNAFWLGEVSGQWLCTAGRPTCCKIYTAYFVGPVVSLQLLKVCVFLLAGANLAEYKEAGACIAGYHSDLNFLTIHGKSRFPGLHIWLRDGRRIPVRIPEGCLLLQAGMQLEWLTGGHVKAGMHEVS